MRRPYLMNEEGGGGGGAPETPQESSQGNAQQPPSVSKDDVVGIVRDNVRRAMSSQIGDLKTDLASMISEAFKGAAPAQESAPSAQTPAPQQEKEEQPGPSDNSPPVHETPMETQMRRLAARLDSLERENSTLKETVDQKEQEMKITNRDTNLLKVINPLAKKPDQVLALIKDKIVEDAEKGWVFEVDGEYGKEFRSPEDFVSDWLEENPFHKKVDSSGSGAGAKSSTVGGKRIDLSKIGDPAYYAEHANEIRELLQQQRGS